VPRKDDDKGLFCGLDLHLATRSFLAEPSHQGFCQRKRRKWGNLALSLRLLREKGNSQ
jgi:hypothetical protein